MKNSLEEISHSPCFAGWDIVVLVHKKKELAEYDNITYIEYPLAKKNSCIIVQQNWIREAMSKLLNISEDKIIVAYPQDVLKEVSSNYDKGTFFYASIPRPFKNFEVILKAARLLEAENIGKDYQIILTFDGTENSYSRNLYNKYSDLKHVKFTGVIPRDDVYRYYDRAECLIFPSKLETWELPISEFKSSGKKMILSDLPYAYEASCGAEQVAYFNTEDEKSLAEIIKSVLSSDESLFNHSPQKIPKEPFVRNWQELFEFIKNS